MGLSIKCSDSHYSGDEGLYDALERTSALVGEGLEVCPPVKVLVLSTYGRLF